MQVFLSYRRADAGGHAGRLTDALTQRLGEKSVFHDVSTIAPGRDFTVAVDHALDGCEAVLAVIGPGWLSASDERGAPRLADPDDYVRRELAQALQKDAPVVPVLVGRAALPKAEDLPPELAALAQRQAVVLHDETWHQDVEGLLRQLKGEPVVPRSRGRLLATVAVVVVLVASTVGFVANRRNGGGDSGDTADPPRCGVTTGTGWTPVRLDAAPTGSVGYGKRSLEFAVDRATWKALEPGKWRVVVHDEMRNDTRQAVYNADYRYAYLTSGLHRGDVACFESTPQLLDGGTAGFATIGFDVECKPVGFIALRVAGDRDRERNIPVTPASAPKRCVTT